jgi:hypothetical protein
MKTVGCNTENTKEHDTTIYSATNNATFPISWLYREFDAQKQQEQCAPCPA